MNPQLVTIVTGGGRGIGRDISLRMAQETSVLVVGRTRSDLRDVCQQINAAGGSAKPCVGDVARPATAQRALKLVRDNGWTVRNLVCNAGIGKGGAVVGFDQKLFQRMYQVNVFGTMWFVQACLPEMIEQGKGAICIMSSVLGVKGYKYQSAYASTKFALVGLAQSIAHEHGKNGITVVPICPGFVDSEMTRRTIAGLAHHRGISPEAAEEIVKSKNPQHRIIPSAEVAEAVAMVCANYLPALNGHPLMLTGGE